MNDPYAAREAANYENPIASRELISEQLEHASGPLSYKKICTVLGVSSAEQKEALRRRLRAMERDGQLIVNRRGEYGLTGKMDLVRGRVQGHRDGFGFVIPTDGTKDIYLTNRQMRKVFDGDEVLVRVGREDYKGRCDGTIVEILARNTHQLVGRFESQYGHPYVRPENSRNQHDIMIPQDHVGEAKPGQFVVVEITQYPERNQRPAGRIMEVLGDHMAPGMEIDVAIRSYGIPHTWPSDVQQQTSFFTAEVKESDKEGRIDLRKMPFVTIDGEDARDFDDAVYCETKRGGGWRLYVAIADVAHYVPAGSALDQEALVRGNSVYFPDFVVPMLPQVLSNGLCSLNPHVDRLAIVCEMTISATGKLSGYKFYEGLIHSHARLTYTKVGMMIGEESKEGSSLRKDYAEVVSHVDELYALFKILRKNRESRGAIDFETNETRIIFDDERKISKIIPVERNDAHKLIEECMLAANVCAAKLLESFEVPALYRVHEGPSDEKLETLLEFLASVGLGMKGRGKITPEDYAGVLSQVGERPDAHIIQTVMLRSLSQARYQPDNQGHFGLAYPAYAHFTSPIRRYPDLLVHRAIRALLRSETSSPKLKKCSGLNSAPMSMNYPYDVPDMVNFGEQCSTTERRADDATRDVISWLKCEYLQDHVGETFKGVVSAVTGFGLFVELSDVYVEGLVHITSLPQDYYHFDPVRHCLIGERSGKTFRLGDELSVQVVRVDLDERKIDFDFVKLLSRRKQQKVSIENQPAKSGRAIRKRKVAGQDKEGAGGSASKKKSSVKKKSLVKKKSSPKKALAKKPAKKKTKKSNAKKKSKS